MCERVQVERVVDGKLLMRPGLTQLPSFSWLMFFSSDLAACIPRRALLDLKVAVQGEASAPSG